MRYGPSRQSAHHLNGKWAGVYIRCSNQIQGSRDTTSRSVGALSLFVSNDGPIEDWRLTGDSEWHLLYVLQFTQRYSFWTAPQVFNTIVAPYLVLNQKAGRDVVSTYCWFSGDIQRWITQVLFLYVWVLHGWETTVKLCGQWSLVTLSGQKWEGMCMPVLTASSPSVPGIKPGLERAPSGIEVRAFNATSTLGPGRANSSMRRCHCERRETRCLRTRFSRSPTHIRSGNDWKTRQQCLKQTLFFSQSDAPLFFTLLDKWSDKITLHNKFVLHHKVRYYTNNHLNTYIQYIICESQLKII